MMDFGQRNTVAYLCNLTVIYLGHPEVGFAEAEVTA